MDHGYHQQLRMLVQKLALDSNAITSYIDKTNNKGETK